MLAFFLLCVLVVVASSVVDGEGIFEQYPSSVITADELKKATDTIAEIAIRMTDVEVALLQRYLSKAKNYFEFGCGGSTMVACKTGPADLTVTSIDSSQEWIDKVMNSSSVETKKKNGQLVMKHVNIGPTGDWGKPHLTADAAKGAWYLYSQAISMTHKPYDLVLVDGRFRVACLLHSFISNPTANVLIHDFFDPGHHHFYKALLEVCEVVDRAHTLVALKPKAGVSVEQLMMMYATYINVVDR